MRPPAGTRRLSRRLRGGWSARSAARRTSKRHRGAFSGPSRRCAGCQRREPCASTARHCSSCSAAGASFGGCAPKSRWTPALPWAAPLPARSGGIKRRPAPSRRRAPASPLPPRQAEEPLLFHLALCAARRSATLLWPRSDAQGRDALRSPFADEAARALGREPSLVPLQPIPLARECADPSELLARAALDAF